MNTAEIKLPFGLNKNNIIVHISNVERGANCNCICTDCKSLLIAVKGKIKQHHFRHKASSECKGESAIHLAAKQEIIKRKKITIPKYTSTVSATDSKGKKYALNENIVKKDQIISFDEVQEEKIFPGMRADILAVKDNKQLIIEIYYRHKVDDKKIEKIKKVNISAIEINISNIGPRALIDMEEFWLYINNPINVQWLHHAKANDIDLELANQLKIQIQRCEEEYKLEETENQIEPQKIEEVISREKTKEEANLVSALRDLKIRSSAKYIVRLNQEAATHPAWKHYARNFPFPIDKLPYFLDREVSNGNWIFGCDRRIWQSAFYSSFIYENGKPFCAKSVDVWLNQNGMKVEPSVKYVDKNGWSHLQLILVYYFSKELPNSESTIREYCNYLCSVGILKAIHDKELEFEVIKNTTNIIKS